MMDDPKSPNQCKDVMLYIHMLKANKPKYKGVISSMPKSTQTLMDRPKTCQDKHKIFTNASLKHAPTKANNLKHVKA